MKLEQELKMNRIPDEGRKAVLNVIFTGNWLTDQFNQVIKPYGLSVQQFNILRILRGQKGNPINLMDIQGRMVHRMSNATRLVEKLRLKNLVKRDLCEENRRKVEITITNEGLKLLETVSEAVVGSNHQPSSKLSHVEAETLNGLIEKLRD